MLKPFKEVLIQAPEALNEFGRLTTPPQTLWLYWTVEKGIAL
jgi:hypothetical protein